MESSISQKHDKNKIFKGYIEFSKRIIRIIWAFHQIQKLYIKYEPKICVKSFWINVYKLIEMNKNIITRKGIFEMFTLQHLALPITEFNCPLICMFAVILEI